MQDLSVISVEHDALVLVGDSGERFRVLIDEGVRNELRRAGTGVTPGRRLSPREIQTHIRSGMSAEDVAAVTGTPLEYIQRFEGPVLAERQFIVESALSVPVNVPLDSEPLEGGVTFGAVIRQRIGDLGAVGERWASWKEDGGGWVVKLAFTVERVDHDARWHYEPKRHLLSPANHDALSLSQQEEAPRPLVPRLRAVENQPESTRFDSAAFQPVVIEEYEDRAPLPKEIVRPASGNTADLLEALRRRRGEREAAAFADLDEAKQRHPSTGSIRLVEIPLEGMPSEEPPAPPAPVPASSRRKGRVSMPSWDEIVFGARPDDDLA